MAESLSRGGSNAAVRSGAASDPSEWASDLFEQYGPCPECGAETVTYSQEFAASDLACYTCGHWFGFHEVTSSGDESGSTDAHSSAGRRGESANDFAGLGALLEQIRSLF